MAPKRKFTLSSLPIVSSSDSVIAKTKVKQIPKGGNLTRVDRRPLQTHRLGSADRATPIIVCVFQATDLASDLWPDLNGTDAKLYQVQVKHDASPSIVFDFLNNFRDFLKTASVSNSQIPADLKGLATAGLIKLVLTGADDPDDVGYVRWRIAFYVAGDEAALKNFFFLFDGFLIFKAEQMALATPAEVHIHQHSNIALDTENLEYTPYVLHPATQILPMKFFDAHPVAGPKRASTLNFETQSAQRVNIIFDALPYHCRNRLIESGMAFDATLEGESGGRFQVMKDINAAKAGEVERVITVCTEVLCKLALRIIIAEAPPPESPAAALLRDLRELPYLH